MGPNDFLKYVKDQYDRLQEISPLLPPEVIADFQKKFENETEISKPEEANGLEKITVFRNDIDLNVSDPNEARSPHIKLRTPKLAKAVADMRENPMVKAAMMAKKTSPNILAAAAPAPPDTSVIPMPISIPHEKSEDSTESKTAN